MTTRYERCIQWVTDNINVGYYSGAGDSNRDGVDDRAQVGDGNGVDCSGAQWAMEEWAAAQVGKPAPFPLSSTAGYAFMSDHMGWTAAIDRGPAGMNGKALVKGDLLIHDSLRNPYASEGPRGHTEKFMQFLPGGMIQSCGSASSKGVDFYTRPASFWCMAIRVPGENDGPIMTQIDWEKLKAILMRWDVEHGMAVDVVLNPNDPKSGYTLDRWGGVHNFGAAVPVTTTAYWPHQDVAREVRITDWAAGKGYVMDLDGALHPFGGAPRISGAPY